MKQEVIMKILEHHYRIGERELVQIKRNKNAAIYKVMRGDDFEKLCGYEVWKIKKQKAERAFGREYPEREVPPCDNDFGKTAWSATDYGRALERYKNLCQ